MATYGVISDIHANSEALRAVLDELDRLGVDRIICLGDIVGYGPDPVECIDLVRSRCDVALCGNHDVALIYGASDFNQVAQVSLQCHRRLVMPRPAHTDHLRRDRWEFLKNMPKRHVEGEFLFVHGAPRNPMSEYLRKIDVLLGMEEKFAQNFELVDWLCFVGHTHRAGIITQDLRWLEPDEVGGAFSPPRHQKFIVNTGSVGQPRDRDARAAFVTVTDAGQVTFRRVHYDVHAVAERLAAMPGMDASLAERLRQGR